MCANSCSITPAIEGLPAIPSAGIGSGGAPKKGRQRSITVVLVPVARRRCVDDQLTAAHLPSPQLLPALVAGLKSAAASPPVCAVLPMSETSNSTFLVP